MRLPEAADPCGGPPSHYSRRSRTITRTSSRCRAATASRSASTPTRTSHTTADDAALFGRLDILARHLQLVAATIELAPAAFRQRRGATLKCAIATLDRSGNLRIRHEGRGEDADFRASALDSLSGR